MPTPLIHDKFIKEILSDRSIAIDFLKAYLPKDLLDFIEIESIKYEKTSYLTHDLEEYFSDIVWSFKTKSQPLKVALLLEHKSFKDPKVVFQLLQYLAMGYSHQIKSRKTIEIIVPIVYYHGKEKWELENINDFFTEYPAGLQKYIPNFSTEYINLANLSSDQILNLQNGLLASSLLIQRNYNNPEQLNHNIFNNIKSLEPYLEKNLTKTIFVYLINFVDTNQVNLAEVIESTSKNLKNAIMSLYEQLMQEGIEKGKNIGLQEGKDIGLQEGKNIGLQEGIEKTIINAHANGIALETIRLITGESLEKIKAVLAKNKQ